MDILYSMFAAPSANRVRTALEGNIGMGAVSDSMHLQPIVWTFFGGMVMQMWINYQNSS